MPELAVAVPASSLRLDPFEGMMPSFLEPSLYAFFKVERVPRIRIEPMPFAPSALPTPHKLPIPARTSKRATVKAQRRQSIKNRRRNRR